MGYEFEGCFQLFQNSFQWQVLVNIVNHKPFRGEKLAEELSNSWISKEGRLQ